MNSFRRVQIPSGVAIASRRKKLGKELAIAAGDWSSYDFFLSDADNEPVGAALDASHDVRALGLNSRDCIHVCWRKHRAQSDAHSERLERDERML